MAILPIALVTLTGIVALILEMLRPKHKNDRIVMASLFGLLLAGVAVVFNIRQGDFEAFADTYINDAFGGIAQLAIVLSAFLCILFSESYLRNKRIPYGEFYPLVLWSTVGGMIMVSSRNMLVIFLGLEILSVALYVLAGMSRQEERSEESAMKYFLLGAFASGFLLFGIAFLYGATGSLELSSLRTSWSAVGGLELKAFMLFGLAMALIGLGFKASLVPFHQWTPDVYQGAPTNVTAFMATVSKIAALGALFRVLDAASSFHEQWLPLLSVVAVVTMLVGNMVALTQKDVKRILAYSSIGHAGYVLVGILAHAADPRQVGITTTAYYLLSYSLMTMAAFVVLSMAAKDGREVTSLDDLRGLYKRSPFAAVTLVIAMLSLIGIPPSAGFIGKLLIFNDAVTAGLTPLAIFLAISSVISIYYYLMIATAAFASDESAEESRYAKATPAVLSACALCTAGVIGLAVFYTPLMRFLGQ